MIEKIISDNLVLAIILRGDSEVEDGVNFYTPDDYSQQLGVMKHPKGHVIPPHVHNNIYRKVEYTKEVLFIKSGRVRVDFYDDSRRYLLSKLLQKGDVILLARGGHGFEILEQAVLIEVKQGPYAGDFDKTRFESAPSHLIKISG